MDKIQKAFYFTYKGVQYPKSGNQQYDQYLGRIKHKGLDMDLTREEFEDITSLPCAYCGEDNGKMGVDRVDSKKGYSKTNCVPSCTSCNLMKMTLSLEVFLDKIYKIHAYQEATKID